MASPEKNNKHRDESLPGDISGDAVEKKDKKAEMLDRMVRFNALDREKVTAKAKELGIAEAVDNYYLIYDYNKYITGSDAEDRFKVDDYTPELMEKNLQRYARQEDCVAKVLAAFDKPKVEKTEDGHGTTDWIQIGKGVCQGCILSPCLFNLYIMRSAGLDETQAGIKIAG